MRRCWFEFIIVCNWGEPERAPHLRGERSIYISIYRTSLATGAFYAGCKMDKMAALCAADACDSNTRNGQLQTRRNLYETKRTLQPLPQTRIQASEEGIAPTNLHPCSKNSQGPKRSSLKSQVKWYTIRTRL